MTTLAVSVNRFGFAVAADAFVGSSGSGTAYADKIFCCADRRPVVVASYGSVVPCMVPHAPLLSRFLSSMPDSIETVDHYASAFLEFLRSNLQAFGGDADSATAVHRAAQHLQAHLAAGGSLPPLVAQAKNQIQIAPTKASPSVDQLVTNTVSGQASVITAAMQAHAIANTTANREAVAALALTPTALANRFGAVFVGCGADEFYPGTIEVQVDGAMGGVILGAKITHTSSDPTAATVKGFAQSEVIEMFRFGITPTLYRSAQAIANAALSEYEKVVGNNDAAAATAAALTFKTELDKVLNDTYLIPFQSALTWAMPRQLAEVSASLVRLTAFHRGIYQPIPTVSEPISYCWGTSGGSVRSVEPSGTIGS